MARFLSMQQTAAALIAKNGSLVTLTRQGAGTFNPVTQADTATTETLQFLAVIIPPSQQARYTVGTLEGRDAVECYFALKGKTTTPQIGDVITVGSSKYRIFWTQTYDPALDGPIFTLAYAERSS
jgi:hypothetical protein